MRTYEGLLPFHFLFPDLAEAECRFVYVFDNRVIPDGTYALLESYCVDSEYDCRRVMINVAPDSAGQILASINFGFDREDKMAGPFLDPLNPQSKYADAFLKLAQGILSDTAYGARLESHYRRVKNAVADPRHPVQEKLRSAFEPNRGKIMRNKNNSMDKCDSATTRWRALYEAAIAFQEIECWRWMYDRDIFGVQNPKTGEIGYCCVMGNLKGLFGIAVYLGTKGLNGLKKMLEQEVTAETSEFLNIQDCLMASFENRDVLSKNDLQQIKRVGLRFRGSKIWPLFRSYRPGYFPWYLEEEEVEYLTVALQQARGVVLSFKENPRLLTPPEGSERHLVRVQESNDAGITWQDTWLAPKPLEPEPPVTGFEDEARISRIKSSVKKRVGTWEIDISYAPMPVKDKGDERPYYPKLLMCLDQRSKVILQAELFGPEQKPEELAAKWLNLIENVQAIPEKIWVKHDGVFQLFEPISLHLGIRLEKVRSLDATDDAQKELLKVSAKW